MDRGEERLRRLEEGIGFAEHSVEQLGAEVRELAVGLAAVTKRLEKLERRLAELTTQPEADQEGI